MSRLSPALQALLVRAAELAHRRDMALWLVGGVVRDLMLEREIDRDLDLVVEGDAIALAQALAAELDGRITATHTAFDTATVMLDSPSGGSVQIDLARARTETYPHPAALPVVQPASIVHDLLRRDFSVNAMALKITTAHGQLESTDVLDPFDGRHDLENGVLRVLHNQSFDDDPTRIVRGLRLAARLDMQLEPHTRVLLAAALANKRLEATTPDRVRTELCLSLAEPSPADVLRLSDEWAVTSHIFAPLCWSEDLATRCARALIHSSQSDETRSLIYTGLLTYDLTAAERDHLIARYRLPNDVARLLREIGRIQTMRDTLVSGLRNSELERLLRPFGATALTVVRYAELSPVGDTIMHYMTKLRSVTPLLNGHALQQLGVTPGPHLGHLLQELQAARLDGIVTTRADEESWVRHKITEMTNDDQSSTNTS